MASRSYGRHMAVVVFANGRKRVISHEQGVMIWQVMNHEIDPTPKQEAFCADIKDLFLNLHDAPQSYLDHYPNRRAPTNESVPYTQVAMFPKVRQHR